MARAEHRGVDIALADVGRLEEIVDREALNEVCRSFFDLFGLPVHVFSEGGSPLADVHEEREICRYVNTLPSGHIACVKTVSAVKDVIPTEMVVHACFTGAVYRIVPVVYQGRRVGRFVIGPYLPAETREVPKSLLVVDPNLDKERARAALTTMPRVREETAERIAQHLARIVDLLLFSSHRAHLTSEMHVASVRESYRELAEKNSKLQSAYDRLRELDRLKSNFLATVSHELRTPLTSIIGYSEMLESGIAGELQGEQLEFVQTIRTKGDHLLALITSLLDLSKLEQGTLKLRLEPLDARAMLEDVAKTLGPTAAKKNVRIEVKVDSDLPEVEVDPVRMRQILWNLSENAVKFTPPNGTIHLGATATELEDDEGGGLGAVLMSTARRAIAFTIRDTGIGMPREELPKIFDAFYQIDGSSTREHGGAGLGLSIVRRLVDAHDGRIEVDSEVGKGTTFTITIPEPRIDD